MRIWLLLPLLALSACASQKSVPPPSPSATHTSPKTAELSKKFSLKAPFAPGGTIAKTFTCDGKNISPTLIFQNAPKKTESFALLVQDPDAPGGTFTHWIFYDIPGIVNKLPEAVPQKPTVASAHQAKNDLGRFGYDGPCPPRGDSPHRYLFTLYALSVKKLGLPPQTSREKLLKKISELALSKTTLIGKYQR